MGAVPPLAARCACAAGTRWAGNRTCKRYHPAVCGILGGPICMASSRKRKKLPGPSTTKEERALNFALLKKMRRQIRGLNVASPL